MKELADMEQGAPPGCTVKLAKDDDLNVWDVVMDGPPESIYAVSPLLKIEVCGAIRRQY